MKAETYLGFDFGIRHIGIAVGQNITQTASPITSLAAKGGEPKWQEVDEIITKWKPNKLIVGIAIWPDEPNQPMTIATKKFAKKLAERYGLTVDLIDESLTTREARNQYGEAKYGSATKRKKVDALAAVLILETWLHENSL